MASPCQGTETVSRAGRQSLCEEIAGVQAGSTGSESIRESGIAKFDVSPGAANRITVVFGKTTGDFFLNGEIVARLDLSLPGV